MSVFKNIRIPSVPAFSAKSVLEREPIELARSVVQSAERNGAVEVYIDGTGRMCVRRSSVIYADELPSLWLVGVYTADVSTVRVMEDICLRLAEVRAANGRN